MIRTAATLFLLCAATTPCRAQSVNDLAAFDALMLSPVGALPPLARDYGLGAPPRTDLSLRYGGWRYDVDDGVHNNVGVEATRRLGDSHTTLSVTGAYLSLQCDCAVWLSGGLALRTTLWSAMRGRVSGHVTLRESVGLARYSGTGHARAYSAAVGAEVGVGVPFVMGTRLAASVFPGAGYGRIVSEDETAEGRRPMVGASVSWMLPHGLAVDVGSQRIIIPGGPAQAGVGLSWHSR